jgi:hypothetical protein
MLMHLRVTTAAVAAAGGLVLTSAATPAVAARPTATTAPVRADWSNAAPSPDKRAEVGVGALGGRVYEVGGTIQRGEARAEWATTSVTSYDPATRSWAQHAPLPRPLTHVGVAALAGKLYAFGGFTSPVHMSPQSAAYAFDPKVNRWEQLPDMPQKLGSVSVVAVDGRLQLLGGRDSHEIEEQPGSPFPLGFGTVRTHLVYDPVRHSWSTAAPLPVEPRDHAGTVVIGHRIHVFGGRTGDVDDNLDRHDVYDTRTGRWSTAAPLPVPRSAGAATVMGGRIVYAGGECKSVGTSQAYDDVTVYTPRTDQWVSVAAMPQAKHAFGAATVGDRAYFLGGAQSCGGGASDDTLQLRLR